MSFLTRGLPISPPCSSPEELHMEGTPGSPGGHLSSPSGGTMAPARVVSGANPPHLAGGASCTWHRWCQAQCGTFLGEEQQMWGQHHPPQRWKGLSRLTLFILSTVVLRRKRVLTLMLWTLSLVRSSESRGCFLGCWRRKSAAHHGWCHLNHPS